MSEDQVVSDVAEELEQLRRQLEAQRCIRRVVFEDSREGVCIMDLQGGMELNAAAGLSLGAAEPVEGWEDDWGFFRLDGTRVPLEQMAGPRAMGGERVDGDIVRCRSSQLGRDVVLSVDARPMPGGRSISVFRDVTERVRMQAELEERAIALAESEAENAALIERLRIAIDQVATPVLRVARDVLVMPIVGVVDAARSGRAAERLLHEVAASGARWVIIDVTGVEVIDTTTADLFAKLTRAVELLGCRASVSGMRPVVARTMVDLGISLDGLPSYRNLRHALEVAMRDTKKQRGRDAARRGEVRS